MNLGDNVKIRKPHFWEGVYGTIDKIEKTEVGEKVFAFWNNPYKYKNIANVYGFVWSDIIE